MRRSFASSLAILLSLFIVSACSDTSITAPTPELRRDAGSLAAPFHVSAMTRNLYVGVDADLLIRAVTDGDPTNDLAAIQHAAQTILETAFPIRAQGLANEIWRERPEFLGLQEVSQLDAVLAPLGVEIHQDFLPVLMAALAQRGLHYVVAAQVNNTQATLDPGPGIHIQIRDADALLIDANRVSFDASSVVARNFTNNVGVVFPGVNLIRGWVAINATVDGRAITVANTHLESGTANPSLGLLRAAQAAELVTSLGTASPVILLGDLNDVVGSPMYQVVRGAGFHDAWTELFPGQFLPGLTCCYVENLSNPSPIGVFDQRIDYVMARGLEGPYGKLLGLVNRTGILPFERLPGPLHPLWPSDHAGVWADVFVPTLLAQH